MLAPKLYARNPLPGQADAPPQEEASLPQPKFRTKGSALFAGGRKRQQLEQSLGEAPASGAVPIQQTVTGQPAPTSEVLPALPQSGALGGSMRQPIDYEALRAQLLPDRKKPSTLQHIASILAPALMAAGGNQAGANAFISNVLANRRADQEYRRDVNLRLAQMQYGDFARQNEADLRAANPFTVGRDRVQFDPSTGQSTVLYDGAQDFEEYAGSLGMQPGTPEYFQAVEDYVLRSAGPSAHERDLELDDYRTENDVQMEGVRQSNRVGMENLRQRNRTGLEGVRQQNRMTLRQTPSAPRAAANRPTGTGDALPTVSSPTEAAKLPSGTRFRTPDGRIKVVP